MAAGTKIATPTSMKRCRPWAAPIITGATNEGSVTSIATITAARLPIDSQLSSSGEQRSRIPVSTPPARSIAPPKPLT